MSDDLWSDEELLDLIDAKYDALASAVERGLRSASMVNLGAGSVDFLTIKDVTLASLVVTTIYQKEESILFVGELLHKVEYSVEFSIDDSDHDSVNTIEDSDSGVEEFTADITIELPLNDPNNIDIVSLDYHDGLNLEVNLSY